MLGSRLGQRLDLLVLGSSDRVLLAPGSRYIEYIGSVPE